MSALENRRFHHRSNKILISFSITILFTCTMYFLLKPCIKLQNTPLLFYHPYPEDDTSCHINDKEYEWFNDLNRNHVMTLKPLDSRIFFHDTSCKGGLTSREACAVESAARANPDWNIQVFFLGPIHEMFKRGNLYKALQNFNNVNLSSIDLQSYFKETPIESVLSTDVVSYLDFSKGRRKHKLVDLLKYLTLFKFGGVYLEMDFIVVNSFNDLAKNWAAKQFYNELGIDALCFSNDKLGRMMANAIMMDISTDYNPFTKDRGLGILYSVLKKVCSTKNIADMDANTCQGLELYDPSFFYPVSYDNTNPYFFDTNPTLQDTYTAYAHRMWSEITDKYKLPNNSRIVKLAKLFCPTVCEMFGDDFGI